MKKILTVIILVCAVVVSCFALAGCTSGDYNYDVPTVIRVGYDHKFPPMGFTDEDNGGVDVGFDLDLARAVGEYLEVTIELVWIEWKTKETSLLNGMVDLIWNGYTISDERAKQVDFTVPYLRNAQVAVVNVNSSFQTLADLNGKQLYLQAGSTAVDSYLSYDFLKDNPVDKLEENVTCFTMLSTNPDAAMITDRVLADYMISQTGNVGKFRIIAEELEPEKYAIGVRRQDVGLRIAVNDALIELAANGELKKIADKWGLADRLLLR